MSLLPPAAQIREAAVQLSSPVSFVDRELASILAVWLNSVHRRFLEQGDCPPDWNYALETAQVVLSRSGAQPGKV